ncbi:MULTISPECIES: type II toxin-antitoxin system RelE/ParE family toxin [unclassified Streptomyces]|uniref:type II toxin-antitoxin system RelE/ParE family toxin n=1 Tax=unclassified Streptomyces TaxID=2593676 RepID=UPI000978DDAA
MHLWLESLPLHHYVMAEQKVDRLAEHATTLGEPYSRHLGGKLRELRFDLGDNAQRITYWLARTAASYCSRFSGTRMRETNEVERALAAQEVCEASHEPAAEYEVYSRPVKEELRRTAPSGRPAATVRSSVKRSRRTPSTTGSTRRPSWPTISVSSSTTGAPRSACRRPRSPSAAA